MIVYRCDLCKKINENNELIKIQVPINKYMYAMNKKGEKLAKINSSVELSNIEICPTCASRMANLLDSLGVSF